jgi:hypothetical protein
MNKVGMPWKLVRSMVEKKWSKKVMTSKGTGVVYFFYKTRKGTSSN